jgi:hypothetical protein
MRRRKRAGTTVPGCEVHRREHHTSRCPDPDMRRRRWSQPSLLFPDAPRGPGGRMRRRKRAGTTVPGCEVHRREYRVRAHHTSRCPDPDMCRRRWSQPRRLPSLPGRASGADAAPKAGSLLFPDAPRGPGGRMRRRKRDGTTVPGCEGHRREHRVRAHHTSRCPDPDMRRGNTTRTLSVSCMRAPPSCVLMESWFPANMCCYRPPRTALPLRWSCY